MPNNTEDLLRDVIDPSTIYDVVSPNLHRIIPNITQKFIRLSKMHRPIQMLSIVKTELSKNRPVIVFSNKSATSDYISIFLNDHDIECVNLNGDMLMQIRVGQFDKFQTGQVHVLSTTDVASRGLDTIRVRNIEHNCSRHFFSNLLFLTPGSPCNQLRFSIAHIGLHTSHRSNWTYWQSRKMSGYKFRV